MVDTITGILRDITDLMRRVSRLEIGPEQKVLSGTGSPEGVYTAHIGALFLRTDGSANTTLYIKESGTGSTGWVGK
jgi:hypothetical protein